MSVELRCILTYNTINTNGAVQNLKPCLFGYSLQSANNLINTVLQTHFNHKDVIRSISQLQLKHYIMLYTNGCM